MSIRTIFTLFTVLMVASVLEAQNKVFYTLIANPETNTITVDIEFDSISSNSAKLVIPKSAPGTYDITNYIAFVDKVTGYTNKGQQLNGKISIGSYFVFDEKDTFLNKVSYEVDIKKMEAGLLGGFASSKSRSGYMGLLGYSVFGFMEGLESNPIVLQVKTPSSWLIFSTLRPSAKRKSGTDSFVAEDFGLLADAQYLMGNSVEVIEVPESIIPLFVAVYSETPIDINEIGRRGNLALNGLATYFGYVPMPHYTIFYEFLKPFSDRHDYGFYMEHLNSMSASNDISNPITSYEENARIGGIVHHMGHSWIPLRSYGTGYRPFIWQTAPLIETIWLNEGFTWYLSFYNVLNNKSILDFFHKTIEDAPGFIREKSLKELSLLGSTQYGTDFRIGKNLFSRGALMAHDLDVFIQRESSGSKSFKDAVLGLLKWTEANKRAFKYDEIEAIMSASTGVDLSPVWNKWQGPMTK